MHRILARCLLVSVLVGCEVLATDWPDRTGRTPEQVLVDLVRFHQRRNVRASVGELADECFTDLDFAAFTAAAVPQQIVKRLQKARDFAEVTQMLRSLPANRRAVVMRTARQTARPTWQTMGFIDRQGRGQTFAGREAELAIARAIVDAFAARLDSGNDSEPSLKR